VEGGWATLAHRTDNKCPRSANSQPGLNEAGRRWVAGGAAGPPIEKIGLAGLRGVARGCAGWRGLRARESIEFEGRGR
jgi:hypothetical protein